MQSFSGTVYPEEKSGNVEQKFDDKVVNKEKKVQILGMIFDSRLAWQDHVQYGVDKCNKRINMLKSLAVLSRRKCSIGSRNKISRFFCKDSIPN